LRTLVLLLLAGHSAVTAFALKDGSVLSVFPPFQERFVYQIFSDLAVSLALLLILFHGELKRLGRSPKPLVFVFLGMAAVGSFAPLVYLLVEKDLFRKGAA